VLVDVERLRNQFRLYTLLAAGVTTQVQLQLQRQKAKIQRTCTE